MSEWREEVLAHVQIAVDHLTAAMSLYRENGDEDMAHSFGVTVAALAHFKEIESR